MATRKNEDHMTKYQFEQRHESKHRRLLACIATGNKHEATIVLKEIWDLAREYRGMR